VVKGMGMYLLIAVGIIAVLLGLNYLGLPAITAGIFWLAWQVVKIILIIVFYAIMLAYVLIKWLWKLFLKLWHWIF
ncbi:MAG: hypothetical protein IKR53_01025, partial [Clostridia bacterium]|nr:hypothetical protein [Clostridia bacterium]